MNGEIDEELHVGRAAAIGAGVGFVGFGAAAAITCLLLGESSGAGVGLGAFVGAWSGVGFGAMMGATTVLSKATMGHGHGHG